MAAADLQSTLESLYGAGGLSDPAGFDSTRALAQLIMGGGRASIGGTPIMGGGGPTNDIAIDNNMGPGVLDPRGRDTGRPIPIGLNATPAGGIDPVTRKFVAVDEEASNAATAAAQATPEFNRVLKNANAIAASLAPKRAGRGNTTSPADLGIADVASSRTLLPNLFGAGSYDPNDPKQVEGVQAQKAQADKLESSRQFLNSDVFQRLPPEVQKLVTTQTLEGAGVLPTKASQVKAEAKAKAEGEREGGKGKRVIPDAVTKAIGTENFDQAMSDAIASGEIDNPQTQLSLQRAHEKKEKDIRVESVDRRLLSGLRHSKETLEGIVQSYENTPAFKTGKLSDTLKTALSTNQKATALLEFNPIDTDGLSPEEVDFATKYNGMLAGLRDFSGDNRFSDNDAVRTLKAVGDPLTGPKVFPRQVKAVIDNLDRKRRIALEDISASGRDTSKFETSESPKASEQKQAPKAGTVSKGYKFKGGDPSKRENWEKE